MTISRQLVFVCSIVLFVSGFALGGLSRPWGVASAQSSHRVFELRTYTAPEGKLSALQARFRDHTIAIFKKHGIGVEWFATPATGDWNDRLYYLLSFEDAGDRERKWANFQADPDWQKARQESEKDGALVKRLRTMFLSPTPYSPKP